MTNLFQYHNRYFGALVDCATVLLVATALHALG